MKQHKHRLIWATMLLCCFTVQADLPPKAKIAVYRIKGLLEHKQDQLPYNQILKQLNQRIPTKFDYQFYYALRAVQLFRDKEADCLFPGSLTSYALDKLPLESPPLHIAKAYFIGLENFKTEAVLDKALRPLDIGYPRGNTYGGNISKLAHHNLLPLNNGANVHELLARKRIDVFIGYIPDSLPIIRANPDKPLAYSEDGFFYSQNDSLLCLDTPTLQPLMKQISIEIQKMHDSGEIKSILHSFYAGPPVPSDTP